MKSSLFEIYLSQFNVDLSLACARNSVNIYHIYLVYSFLTRQDYSTTGQIGQYLLVLSYILIGGLIRRGSRVWINVLWGLGRGAAGLKIMIVLEPSRSARKLPDSTLPGGIDVYPQAQRSACGGSSRNVSLRRYPTHPRFPKR